MLQIGCERFRAFPAPRAVCSWSPLFKTYIRLLLVLSPPFRLKDDAVDHITQFVESHRLRIIRHLDRRSHTILDHTQASMINVQRPEVAVSMLHGEKAALVNQPTEAIESFWI